MKKIILLPLFLMIINSALSQNYMFVFLNKKENPESPQDQLDKLMEGHMANMGRLAKEGKLAAAGPFDGGGGIFIFRSNSKSKVEEWISTDPGVQAKRWSIEILPYTPRIGSVCSAPQPYEMVSYNFIRFVPLIAKDTFSELGQAIKDHNQYVKKLGEKVLIIQEATFGDEGTILIVKGDLPKDLLDQDPGVLKSAFTYDIKNLYIAKGSFCEK